jgi:hypothetical protein
MTYLKQDGLDEVVEGLPVFLEQTGAFKAPKEDAAFTEDGEEV